MRAVLFWLAMLVCLVSHAQDATTTRKGVISVGSGLTTATGPLSVSIARTTLPQGTLYDYGTKKELYVSTTVNANSKVVINLTTDNTSTGTPIFSTILHATVTGWVTGSTANDVIILTPEPMPSGNRVFTARAGKGTSVVIGGATLANVPAGTPVTIAVHGY
jgi:hypothetical protein